MAMMTPPPNKETNKDGDHFSTLTKLFLLEQIVEVPTSSCRPTAYFAVTFGGLVA